MHYVPSLFTDVGHNLCCIRNINCANTGRAQDICEDRAEGDMARADFAKLKDMTLFVQYPSVCRHSVPLFRIISG